MKFKFEAVDTGPYDGEARFCMEFEVEKWPEVLEHMDQFLRGVGYFPPPTRLTYEEENEEIES